MKSFRLLIPAVAMAILILDAKTALEGAQAGLEMCIRSVIPSLFPFLFLSVMLTGSDLEAFGSVFRPLGQLCRVPAGAEPILAVGLIGGYPVGAQSVAQAYREGRLDRESARRMLGFCSNAGPSFLFGFLSACFSSQDLWMLWSIHILSAIITGILLPGGSRRRILETSSIPISPVSALEQSVRTMGLICGWVMIFRVLLAFLRYWFLWMLPRWADVLVSGLLELTNGCCQLSLVESQDIRFILASALLAFGGICVWLQTASVTQGLGCGCYLPGKLIQTVISLILAGIVRYRTFPIRYLFPLFILTVMGIVFFNIWKKHSSNLARQGV